MGRLRITVAEDRTSRSVRLDMEKIVKIGGFVELECFVSNRENIVANALIDFKPM